MGLKYIYVGYSKCGTKTIAELFKSLNFKVHDFKDSLLDTALDWDTFLNDPNLTHAQRITLLRKIFENYEICTDTPSYLFWEELLEAFPEAKCIFYERPEQEWLKSFQKQMEINNNLGNIPTFIVEWLFYLFSKKSWAMRNVQAGICPLVTGQMPTYCKDWRLETFKFNEVLLLNAYRRHNANFIKNCPEDKRLILKDLNSKNTFGEIMDFIGQKNYSIRSSKNMPHMNKQCEYTKVLMNANDGLIYRTMIDEILSNLRLMLVYVGPLIFLGLIFCIW